MLRVIKQLVSIPVFVMIRPRGGDFLYSAQELAVMVEDISHLKQAGADGFVLGALRSNGTVDMELCQELIVHARPMQVTFHRAIDVTENIVESLECVIRLGCERVLTSGGETSSLEGAPVIRQMVQHAGDRIVVMAGGGITRSNLRRVLDHTGCREVHASARTSRTSGMTYTKPAVAMGTTYGPSETTHKVTDKDVVSIMLQIARGRD